MVSFIKAAAWHGPSVLAIGTTALPLWGGGKAAPDAQRGARPWPAQRLIRLRTTATLARATHQ